MHLPRYQHFPCRCGYTDLIPKLWVEKINAVIPGIGFHVRWHGLWMEVAEGVSMENFLHKGRGDRASWRVCGSNFISFLCTEGIFPLKIPCFTICTTGEPSRFPPSVILDLMHNKLNKTSVIRGAIFDLLTSQVGGD